MCAKYYTACKWLVMSRPIDSVHEMMPYMAPGWLIRVTAAHGGRSGVLCIQVRPAPARAVKKPDSVTMFIDLE